MPGPPLRLWANSKHNFMALHELHKLVRTSKTLGRGHGKRGGKSGRGMKGQRSRAGYSRKAGFEGGQTPLYMRLPKARGSKQKFLPQMQKPVVVNITMLAAFAAKSIVGPAALRKAGLLETRHDLVKLIGNTKLKRELTVRVHAVSAGATLAIENAGGKVEIIS